MRGYQKCFVGFRKMKKRTPVKFVKDIEHLENEKDFSKFGGIVRDEKGREMFVTPDKHECLADYND